MKRIIILNDLRSVPVVTALKLKRNFADSKIIAHESIFSNKEYADYTNTFWKQLLKYILVLIFDLKIIKSKIKKLDEFEKLGLVSSLFSVLEDSSASIEKYPVEYNELFKLSLGAKDVVNYIDANKIKSVFIFNGRTSSSYLIAKYCNDNKLNIIYYEYAGHSNGFRLYSEIPHALTSNAKTMLNYYRNGIYSIYDLKKASNKIRYEKLNHDVKAKTKKKININYDVCIFLGSDFEYTGVDPDLTGVSWSGNSSFCNKVIMKYGSKLKYAIRCHPNSEIDPNWPNLFNKLLKDLSKNKNIIDIYGPDSKIDSHSLIINSDIVVTDLSSIALDVILLGKKVDIFGNTDIRFIYNNDWFKKSSGNLKNKIIEPFSLIHNVPVFRFSLIERLISNVLFLVHRSFQKFLN